MFKPTVEVEEDKDSMMNCVNCAAENSEHASFCQQCGFQLSGETVADDPRERLRTALPNGNDDDTPEREIWQGKYSKLAMASSCVYAGVFTLGMLLIAAVGGFSGRGWAISLVLLVVVWLGVLGLLLYRQLSQRYNLTDRRFIHERGILWRETDRIEAIDIDDISYQQGPIERMLGVGKIRIRSSDHTHPWMELPGIEKVRDVAEMIDEVRRQERRKRGLHIEAV